MDLQNIDFDKLMKSYYKSKFLHDIQAKAVHSFLPNDIEDLEIKQKRLEILQQKKSLGIPYSSDDYEESVNEDKSFLQKDRQLMTVGFNWLYGKYKPLPDLTPFEKPEKMNFLGKMLKFK